MSGVCSCLARSECFINYHDDSNDPECKEVQQKVIYVTPGLWPCGECQPTWVTWAEKNDQRTNVTKWESLVYFCKVPVTRWWLSYWYSARKEAKGNALLGPKDTTLAVLHSIIELWLLCNLKLLVINVYNYVISGSLIKIVAFSSSSYSYLLHVSIYVGTHFVSFDLLYNIELQTNNFNHSHIFSKQYPLQSRPQSYTSHIHHYHPVFLCTCRWQQAQALGAVCVYKEHCCVNSCHIQECTFLTWFAATHMIWVSEGCTVQIPGLTLFLYSLLKFSIT